MDAEVLERLGLSRNEAKAYLALLSLKEAKNAAVAARAGIHRRNCYDALNNLVDKGLVAYRVEERAKVYRCLSPENLVKLQEEAREAIDRVMPELLRSFAAPPVERDVVVLRGIEGAKRMMAEGTGAKRRVYAVAFSRLMYFDNPSYLIPLNKFMRSLGIRGKMLLLDTPEGRSRARKMRKPNKLEIRFFESGEPKAITFVVADDVVFINFSHTETADLSSLFYVRIASRDLADVLEGLFEKLWAESKK